MIPFPTQAQYLAERGVLQHGSDEEIQQAKKQYRKAYQRFSKQRRRKERREFQPAFTSHELHLLENKASQTGSSITRYIHDATLAYAQKGFLVPASSTLEEIRLLLNQIYHLLKENPNAQTLIEHLEHRMHTLCTQPQECTHCRNVC